MSNDWMKTYPPDRELGYSMTYLELLFGPGRFQEFCDWSYHETKAIDDDGELVAYPCDVEAFLNGRYPPDDPRAVL